jgi:hypothetical protein
MREFVSVSRNGALFILNNDSTGMGRGWGGGHRIDVAFR